jgi:hypothetical protein
MATSTGISPFPPIRFEQTVKFANDASGKDRLLRLFIYVGRLAMWALKRRGLTEAAARIKALDSAFNHTRRVLRLGKLGNAVKQWRDCNVKFGSSAKWAFFVVELFKITAGNVYICCDHMRWLGEIGVFKNIDWKKWGDWSTWCWFAGLIGSLVMDALQLRASLAREQLLLQDLKDACSSQQQQPQHQLDQRLQQEGDAPEASKQDTTIVKTTTKQDEERTHEVEKSLKQLRQARELIYWDLAKNVWDAPLAVMGSFKLTGAPGGVLELCGTMSSLINVYLSWRAMFPPPAPK